MNLLQHLRYFVAVAEERHFGRAAERLQMAQPPLSQQIRRLEREVGTPLFTRTTRRVDLTPAGAAYLERARAILAAVDEAAEEARRVAAGLVGHLVIGCVGSVTYSLLPALARRLASELPGIDVSFRGEMLAAEQIEAVRTGIVDLALLRPPVTDGALAVTPLREDRLVVAIPQGHRLAGRDRIRMADLAEAEFIVHSADRKSAMYGVVQRLAAAAGFTPRIQHEVGETSTVITLVAGGLGVAVVPEPVTALALAGVVFRPLTRPAASVELVAAHRADRLEPHLQRTLELVRELTGEEPGSPVPGPPTAGVAAGGE
ncbi:DNA-binding transcriptional LysR family regulator [Propionibacteriaceae bacterium ES.041]|uniref:LysR family transcriptional regulator n=1 Tax=Enemella evansiae TaxID=2016499 RepID=UPI000B9728EF|nr:LysR family transcriptional regulator [Enemella evansiae]OYN96400.1 LysR family transcriptional regulator [Enemella evansiae]PFG65656.1 DNA-binding transcriptional LysR family regulator [Propionibacteriaceae bacterium ES.041]